MDATELLMATWRGIYMLIISKRTKNQWGSIDLYENSVICISMENIWEYTRESERYARILERHEQEPVWPDIDKISLKEEWFKRWCKYKERVRDIINARKAQKERDRRIREKMKWISRMVRALTKVQIRKQLKEDVDIKMKTHSVIKNVNGGVFSHVAWGLKHDILEGVSTEELVWNLVAARFTSKGQKSKAARKFLDTIQCSLVQELTQLWIPTDEKSIADLYASYSQEVKDKCYAAYMKGLSFAPKGKRV